MSERLRAKRPPLECFNCLSTNHRVHDCPVRIDDERIAIHRNMFNTQSAQAHEQAQLNSSRYTSGGDGSGGGDGDGGRDSRAHRGFVPGKISDELREALGVRSNQLPPFVYVMRMYGYPPGWFLDAQVRRTKLAVLDGVDATDAAVVVKKEQHETAQVTTTGSKLGDEVAAAAEAVVRQGGAFFLAIRLSSC